MQSAACLPAWRRTVIQRAGAGYSRAPSVGLLFRFVAQRRRRVHSSVTDSTHHRISLYNDGCGCEARVFNARGRGWIE